MSLLSPAGARDVGEDITLPADTFMEEAEFWPEHNLSKKNVWRRTSGVCWSSGRVRMWKMQVGWMKKSFTSNFLISTLRARLFRQGRAGRQLIRVFRFIIGESSEIGKNNFLL